MAQNRVCIRICFEEIVELIDIMRVDVLPGGLGFESDVRSSGRYVETDGREVMIRDRAQKQYFVTETRP